ncbi:alpha/beta fold hydrolase [Amycolatopsis sp. TRM77291]
MGSSKKPGYVETRLGWIHYVEEGDGHPVVMLHQTPRSADEFRELLPLLAVSHRAIAVDMPGFGYSSPLPAPQTIEVFADGVVAFLDAMGLEAVTLLGHHTGAVVALEIAATFPDRVRSLVLSSMGFVDAASRLRRQAHAVPDDVGRTENGDRLKALWEGRAPLYPPGREDLLQRFVRDAIAPGIDPAEGHRAVGRYHMEDRISLVSAPTLLIGATLDPVAFPELAKVQQALTAATKVKTMVVEGGRLPLMELNAPEVAAAVQGFLAGSFGANPVVKEGRP